MRGPAKRSVRSVEGRSEEGEAGEEELSIEEVCLRAAEAGARARLEVRPMVRDLRHS